MNDMTPFETDDPRTAKSRPDSLALLSEKMTSQALSLDALFIDLIGHASGNMEQWPGSALAYARAAFRAQTNCRVSLEAAARAEKSAGQGEGGGRA